MTNFNTLCFYRKDEPGKRDAICLCKKCREHRANNKKEVTIEDRKNKAIETINSWTEKESG